MTFYLKSFLYILIFLGISIISQAQNVNISGKVIDAQTREPLAFVNIIAEQAKFGTSTDIDGKFSFDVPENSQTLKLSYVGYQTKSYSINGKYKNNIILLQKINLELSEVVIVPGINPAHRIIKKVIENRDRNNPEKNLDFTYTSYNKLVFTADASMLKTDTVTPDTVKTKIEKFLSKRDIMLLESVSERYYKRPDKNFEKVIASRVSGLKDPFFAFLATQIQSFSFYKELISIGDKNYLNPIADGSISKYYYQMEDTIYSGKDTVFIISFRPYTKTNFDGIKGSLYINTNGFALQNVLAEPAKKGGMEIVIQQKYELLDSIHWFPVQLNTDITVKSIQLGRMYLVGNGRTYIKDIEINPKIKNGIFSNTEIEVTENAGIQKNDYWNKYRYDSLTKKDMETYRFMDSIGKKMKFDRRLKNLQTLLSGKISVKFIDIDLDKIVVFNEHEYCRLGLGLHTNNRITKYVSVGGYFGYGFSDKAFKYGFDALFKFDNFYDLHFTFAYKKDLSESANPKFINEKITLLSPNSYRDYFVLQLDRMEQKHFDLNFIMLKYLKTSFAFDVINKQPDYDYYYKKLFNNFNFTTLTLGLRYAYKETYVKTRDYKFSMGTKYPILEFQYTHGFDGLLNGQYNFNRYEAKISGSIYTKLVGKTSITLKAGYLDSDIPYSEMFNGLPSFNSIYLYAPISFVTMRYNEFATNRYAILFFTHSFGKLLINKKRFHPEIAITTNVLWGDNTFNSSHFVSGGGNLQFKTPDKVYLESGLLINNVLNLQIYGIGVGVYYRYGYYTFDKIWDNFGIKWTLTIPF